MKQIKENYRELYTNLVEDVQELDPFIDKLEKGSNERTHIKFVNRATEIHHSILHLLKAAKGDIKGLKLPDAATTTNSSLVESKLISNQDPNDEEVGVSEEKANPEVKKKNAMLTKNLLDLQKETIRLRILLTDKTKEIKKMDNDNQILWSRLKKYEKKIQDISSKNEILLQENTALKEKLGVSDEKDKNMLIQQREILKKQLSEAEKNNREMKEQQEEMERDLADLAHQFKALQQEKEDLRLEKEDLRRRTSVAENSLNKLRNSNYSTTSSNPVNAETMSPTRKVVPGHSPLPAALQNMPVLDVPGGVIMQTGGPNQTSLSTKEFSDVLGYTRLHMMVDQGSKSLGKGNSTFLAVKDDDSYMISKYFYGISIVDGNQPVYAKRPDDCGDCKKF